MQSNKSLLVRSFLFRFVPTAAAIGGLVAYVHIYHDGESDSSIVLALGAGLILLAAGWSLMLARGTARLAEAVRRARESEAALNRSAVFLDGVLNSLPTAVFVKDRAGRFLMVNDAHCRQSGIERAEWIGRTEADFLPAAQAALFEARNDEVFATRAASLHEETLTGRDGEQHTLLTQKAVFVDPSGRDVLVGVITDITDRKRAEDALTFAASVFEHSTEGIFITDAENRIVQVNRAFTEITGYPAAEVLGRNPHMLSSGQHDAAFYGAMWQALRRDGYWQGEVVNRRKDGSIFAEWLTVSAVRSEAGGIQRYVAQFSDITERKVSEERTRYLAQHDVLTGLVNRSLLGDRLHSALMQAQRGGRRVGVLMLDLDRFKPINDRLGHAAGDALLREVAHRLGTSVRRIDTVARVGGDEFVVVLVGIHGAADAALVAERLIGTLVAPFDIAGRSVTIGASIGIALDQDHGADVDGLLRSADAAMYRAKKNGGNAYAMADPQAEQVLKSLPVAASDERATRALAAGTPV